MTAPVQGQATTPLAYFLADTRLETAAYVGFLRGDSLQGRYGVHMLEPYQPGKVPVVLVHGLLSSPLTWMPAFNDLRADPALRDRFQFWFYFYPTGDPYLATAADLRRDLENLRAGLDPEHRGDPADSAGTRRGIRGRASCSVGADGTALERRRQNREAHPVALDPTAAAAIVRRAVRGRRSVGPGSRRGRAMGRMCKGLLLAAALLGLTGCPKENLLQPPKPKDELKTPPADDPRFLNPPNYPNKLLNQDTIQKSDDDDAAPGKGGHGGGGGGGGAGAGGIH